MRRFAPAALVALVTILVAEPASAAGGSTTRLAFIQGGSVYVARVDGTHARKLGAGDEPVLSPNGSVVAAASSDGVRVYSASGGRTRDVLSHSDAIPEAFSHDSAYLAVVVLGSGPSGTRGAGLDVVDVANGTVRRLARGTVDGVSFAPSSDTLVYGISSSELITKPVNLDTVSVTGADGRRLTRNGRSLNPVWGRRGIVFDERTYRGVSKNPEYQLFGMDANGTHVRQLSHTSVPPLLDGLTPVAFSANGQRLIANFTGEDTVEAYAVTLSPFRATEVKIDGRTAVGGGISSNGRSLLVDTGFESASGDIDTVPFGGGPAKRLTTGLEPSSNF